MCPPPFPVGTGEQVSPVPVSQGLSLPQCILIHESQVMMGRKGVFSGLQECLQLKNNKTQIIQFNWE